MLFFNFRYLRGGRIFTPNILQTNLPTLHAKLACYVNHYHLKLVVSYPLKINEHNVIYNLNLIPKELICLFVY